MLKKFPATTATMDYLHKNVDIEAIINSAEKDNNQQQLRSISPEFIESLGPKDGSATSSKSTSPNKKRYKMLPVIRYWITNRIQYFHHQNLERTIYLYI